ncbi:kinase-like domain-containing protein [Glomus cerebriforme]|uniref:Kinase-like domain-containing protein n=1 Tax=Glomus cerebriforme TaxID=658196 RepID=A0A397T437_9GLOM|nr:kinase-like domain-containing protein [Glomus cerebriforme]
MDTDLREYLQHQRTWKEKINVAYDIIEALYRIHKGNAIHRDLHSGNILYLQDKNLWYISDLGFCGPVDRPLKSIYGNLPYIAPEVIVGKEYTFKSDIYSFGILMWEISSGQTPFNNYEHNYDLAIKIVNGMRPEIVSTIPLDYENLMKQCWDANPLNRPNINDVVSKIKKMWKESLNNITNIFECDQVSQTNVCSNSELHSLSKLYQFKNLPKPRNASEEQQEGEEFYDNPYDFSIFADNFENSDNPNLHLKGQDDLDDLEISKNEEEIINENKIYNKPNFYSDEQDYLKNSKGENEIYNNPNLHSDEQNDLEIPEGVGNLIKSSTIEGTCEKEIHNNPNFCSENKEDNLKILKGNDQSEKLIKSNIIKD